MMTRLRKPHSAVHEPPLAIWKIEVSLTLQPGTFLQRVENKGLCLCQDLPSCFCKSWMLRQCRLWNLLLMTGYKLVVWNQAWLIIKVIVGGSPFPLQLLQGDSSRGCVVVATLCWLFLLLLESWMLGWAGNCVRKVKLEFLFIAVSN